MPITLTPDNKAAAPPPRAVPPSSAPPRKNVAPPVKPPKDPIALASKSEIEKWFLKTYMMLAIGIGTVRPMTGNQIMESAPKCAKANAELVFSDPKMRRAISQMMIVGKWGPVIAAHLPIVLVAIAEQRPIDPDSRFDQNALLGLADLLGDQEKFADVVFGGSDDDDNSA